MRFSLLSIVISALLLGSCQNSEDMPATTDSATTATVAGDESTSIEWIDQSKDYGKINEGQKLALSFRFRNSGNKPLIIEDVRPTCGCTVANFPKEPIAPGGEGEITGEFDSNGRQGLQRKHITVRSNANPAEQDISFEVNVIGKATAQQENTFN